MSWMVLPTTGLRSVEMQKVTYLRRWLDGTAVQVVPPPTSLPPAPHTHLATASFRLPFTFTKLYRSPPLTYSIAMHTWDCVRNTSYAVCIRGGGHDEGARMQ